MWRVKVFLPKEWERHELGDVVTLKSGGTPNRATDAFWGGDVPWITAKDLKFFDLKDSIECLMPVGAAQLNIVPAGTILILVRGMGLFKDFPIGLTCREMTFNQDVKALIPRSKINSRFLACALMAMRGAIMGRVDRAGHGTGRLATDYLVALPIAFPPLPEQQRIVAVLDTWNQAIDQTERVIAAKRRLHHSHVSALIPMNTDGNSNGWRMRGLVELGRVVNGGTPASEEADYWNGDIPWITPSEVSQLRSPQVATTERYISPLGLKNSSAELLPIGSLIVCTRATVGACCINSAPMATNQGFKSLVPKAGFEIRFVYHAVNARQKDMIRLANGSTFLEVTKPDFENLQIAVPSLGEQIRIADALDAEATEIALLEESVGRLKTQKRGLMQKLLTGEWRLDERFDPQALAPHTALAGGAA